MEKHCVARPLKRVPAIFLLVPLESKRRCRARARARGRRIATRCTTVNHHHPTPVARRHRKGCGRVCGPPGKSPTADDFSQQVFGRFSFLLFSFEFACGTLFPSATGTATATTVPRVQALLERDKLLFIINGSI